MKKNLYRLAAFMLSIGLMAGLYIPGLNPVAAHWMLSFGVTVALLGSGSLIGLALVGYAFARLSRRNDVRASRLRDTLVKNHLKPGGASPFEAGATIALIGLYLSLMLSHGLLVCSVVFVSGLVTIVVCSGLMHREAVAIFKARTDMALRDLRSGDPDRVKAGESFFRTYGVPESVRHDAVVSWLGRVNYKREPTITVTSHQGDTRSASPMPLSIKGMSRPGA